MKFFIVIIALIVNSASASTTPVGSEVTDSDTRAKIFGELFQELRNAPFNNTSLAFGVGEFLGQNPGSTLFLTCEENNSGHGADVLFRCDFIIGYGQSPSMKIFFTAKMDAAGKNVMIHARSIGHEVSP